MRNHIYYNHDGAFVDIPNPLKDELVEFQETETFRSSKESVEYFLMTVLDRKYTNY